MPCARQEYGQCDQQAEEHLADNAVDDGDVDVGCHDAGVRAHGEETGHPQAAEDALDGDECQCGPRGCLDPARPAVSLHGEGQHQCGQADQRAEQAVGVFVIDTAGHAAERVQEHVVAEGVGPVHDGQPFLRTGHQAAGDDQQQGCGGGEAGIAR